jgi:hypothetical protein
MPRPNQGDLVLFSNDPQTFSNPTLGWVMKEPGSSTVQLLVFTEQNGWLVKPSVHHRSDPNLGGDNQWDGLGVWDFTESTKTMMAEKSRRTAEAKTIGRETVAR